MSKGFRISSLLFGAALLVASDAWSQTVRTGKDAFGDTSTDAPGVWRHITPADLPAPFATGTVRNMPKTIPRPSDATPKVPTGFKVSVFASGLQGARRMRMAPNGDIFIAENLGGRISIMRSAPGSAKADQVTVFAEGLHSPYGIAFYPEKDPQWVYVANTDSVVRFPYKTGDVKASGPAQVIVPSLPSGGGHWTRDLAFSPDGTQMFISVGSGSNVGEKMPKQPPADMKLWEAEYGLGAGWGNEVHRAAVLTANPLGQGLRTYATGIRNCAGLSMNAKTGDLWCTVNERDELGDDLAPDYSTRVKAGQFYGWPWYYIGSHPDPRRAGERPDLADKVSIPDVLYQPHSAALQMAFYSASGAHAFPKAYDGDAFVTLHGSWNRSKRTGYKVVRLRLKNGAPTGEYQDFMTGFLAADGNAWGRPVGVVETKDGSLLVSDDGGNVVWRVTHSGH
ncbi:MAG TPA: sorbosone dehydrogenase family protein [Caulobacteraceae bacterium]|nr:sorbosone dehydrogenase family protein [Caulobacteraceae bacterium]